MSEQPDRSHSLDELPQARMENNWKTRLIWLVPVVAAAIAAWFIYSQLFRGGPTLHIYFDNAAGLEPGKSQVKFRGTHIGDVEDVKLTKDHTKVDVSVKLDGSAESVARESSQFWIVKPELGAEEIRGLRTIVSGDYIMVEPGVGKPQTHFNGLAEAPVVEPEGVLRIVLLAEKSGSLKERSPVFYRGIQVGEVSKTDLGKASQAIRIIVDIQKHYAPLIRMNSKFWNAGGIHANISLSGLSIGAQSAETLLSGGIDFATPDTAQQEAIPKIEFRLYDKPEDAWLGWAPAIDLEDSGKSSGAGSTASK
jgi:paraquat-inducible protein B